MTEFLKQCAEKDTLTSEDRKRLVEVATTIENLKDEIEKWRERSDWQDDVFENIRSELLNSNLELQCFYTENENCQNLACEMQSLNCKHERELAFKLAIEALQGKLERDKGCDRH